MEDAKGTFGGPAKFSAFLSYSHADAAAVRKLHAQLESYRLPKDLGQVDALNEFGGRLGQIFRDRDDLSAAESLSQAITSVLDQSEVLVAVCSPDAKASHWVNQEIAYFREHRPGLPILAAIVRGEPADALPDALTADGEEPLAADLRKEGDGWKLGFLKVVSGIAGVPLDALVQRDAQRQSRRVMAITGVSVAAALIMAIMTTVAIQSRNEAQFQQAEAEGLVAYMMDDLRDELKGVGRLDVMEGVNERALRYYSNQGDLSRLAPDSLEQRAKVLHAMGEDAEDRGNLDEAMSNFEQAYRSTQELLDREPNNPERIFAHSQSAYWVGYIAWEKRDNRNALENWQAYRDLAGQLQNEEPEDARSYLELGYSEGNLCTFFLRDDRDPARAEDHCLKAIEYLEQGLQIAPSSVDLIKTLANRSGWLARHYGSQDRFEDALLLRKREGQLMSEILSKDPANNNLKMRLSWALAGEAEMLSKLAQHEQALSVASKAKRLGVALIAAEPNSMRFLSSNVQTFVKVAEVEKRANSPLWRASARRSANFLQSIKQLDENEFKELESYAMRSDALNREL